ncbi:MAG: Gldg family protein, partial [Planctomycetota bacterium]
MNKTKTTLIGLAVALVLFFAVNVFSQSALRSSRIDLTENNLYTLSDGSKNILKELDQDVTLHFFFSKKLADEKAPQLNTYATRVLEMLEEYEAAAGGRLTLEVADPEPFSEAEDRAMELGLRGAPVGVQGEFLYFGLAGTNETDGEEVIPFLLEARDSFLEYDVTKMISALTAENLPVVGLMSTLPLRGGGVDPRTGQPAPGIFLLNQVEEQFELRDLEITATEIADDVSILMLIHPQNLSDETLYAIDQFVLRGGKLLCFVDPHCEVQMPPPNPQNPMEGFQAEVSSDLTKLFDVWGIEMIDEKIASDRDLAIDVPIQGAPTPVVIYLRTTGDQFTEADPITAELDSVNMGTAGILRARTDVSSDVAFAPLITTTTKSMEVDRYQVALGPDPGALLRDFAPSGEEMVLAARLTGNAKSAFPAGAPAAPATAEGEEASTDRAHLSESTAAINVIVVADVDMLQDNFWVRIQNFLGSRIAQPIADNANLVINTLDNLTGSNDLISLRSRGTYARPFTTLNDIRAEADKEFRAKEEELEQKLQDAEAELSRLQSQRDDQNALILTDEQRAEIEKFTET